MYWTIFIVMMVLWGAGLVGSFTGGGYIHLLLVVALTALLVRSVQRRVIWKDKNSF